MALWRNTQIIYKLLLLYIWAHSEVEGGPRLSAFVDRYEVLKYDAAALHGSHMRAKRSIDDEDKEVAVKFNSHGEWFHLRLRRDTSTIRPDVNVEMPAHLGRELDTSILYHGTLADEPSSRVWGSVVRGVFEGVIERSPDRGTYYVEGAHRYFPRHNATRAGFHSVIYRDNAIEDPFVNQRSHPSGCGAHGEAERWMNSLEEVPQQSETSKKGGKGKAKENCDQIHPKGHFLAPEYRKMKDNFETEARGRLKMAGESHMTHQDYERLSELMYRDLESKYGHTEDHHDQEDGSARRRKRSLLGVGADNRGTCTLSIQTDPMLWHHIHDKTLDDVERTKDEITALISQHVKAINNIYGDVIFQDKYKHQGIRFEVQRIKIEDWTLCQRPSAYGRQSSRSSDDSGIGTEVTKSNFCRPNVDVSNFLNLHSKTKHDDFCLAYVFTFRDFTGGTLGLAWVASPSGASGGICEKYKTYTENLAGFRNTEERSLNTGIITFLNYNNRVPPKVSQLTLAHEIGHNFGSPHDYPERCKPGGLRGNYIMFSSATSGDRPNNSRFSPCSIANISKVLDAIVENRPKNCFQVTHGAFCGNKLVEEGEECDCGYNAGECQEKCCYPKKIDDAEKAVNGSARPCARRQFTACSPSEGPCCERHSCGFSSGRECLGSTDCAMSARCDGQRAQCPTPQPRRNLTLCNENTQVCLGGVCSGSICLSVDLPECFLTSEIVTDKKKLCEIACLVPAANGGQECRSTSDLKHIFNTTVFMRPGAPCNNFQGYCDVFQKCRAVDAEGPLARLKNLLLSEDTLKLLSEWVTQYWYVVLLLGVAFVVVLGGFIRCCAVHTPSSNPAKPAARSIARTLRTPVHTLRRVKRHRAAHQGPRSVDPQRTTQNNADHSSSAAPSSGGQPLRHSRPTSQVPPAGPSTGPYHDDPPPPYPGSRPPPTRHGYGQGRGHYNRPKGGKRQENSAV